jgi:hypothetical protein
MSPRMAKQTLHHAGIETTIEPLDIAADATEAEILAKFREAIDSCPDCQAARARGEEPQLVHGRELLEQLGLEHRPRWKRPRWRELRRRVRIG